MNKLNPSPPPTGKLMAKTLAIIGLGAFGQLMARHLQPHFQLLAHDPSPSVAAFAQAQGVPLVGLAEAARADYVVIATPVEKIAAAATALAPHLRPETLVLDVGSVKALPAETLRRILPPTTAIVCTHPLFGPQSARDGIAGLKIAVCPVRGEGAAAVAQFLHETLRLEVIVTTPEEHDREMAAAQGLTHMIAKILVEMEPLPRKLTTVSFDHIVKAIEMVRYDSLELFLAIQRNNPYAAELRHSFFDKADALRKHLEETER